MSAAVASPMAGLLNRQVSQQDLQDFTAHDFSNQMSLDHFQDPMHDHEMHGTIAEHASADAALDKDHDNAQQLAQADLTATADPPINETAQAFDANNIDGDTSITNEEVSQDAQAEFVNQAELNAGIDPAYAHVPFPTLDPFTANDQVSGEDLTVPEPAQFLALARMQDDQDMPQFYPGTSEPIPPPPPEEMPPQLSDYPKIRREYQAFARLEFPDGSFYINTYQCELGRDLLALKEAQKREDAVKAVAQEQRERPRSAGARSRRSDVLRQQMGSQMQGSIVSDAGGFAGVDESEAHDANRTGPDGLPRSSQASESSGTVKPHEVLRDPTLMPFDYKRRADEQREKFPEDDVEDNEKAAAVTEDHVPTIDPDFCPLIPIHRILKPGQSEVANHKSISRRHVKIYWSFARDQWEIQFNGRNGGHVNGEYIKKMDIARLEDGAEILVGHIDVKFRLPKHQELPVADEDEGMGPENTQEEIIQSIEELGAEDREEEDLEDSTGRQTSTIEPTPTTNIKLKIKPPVAAMQPILGPDGQPVMKKRGPGRPPKDGIMSTRQRKELEKAEKIAEAKLQNGGKTPPPSLNRPKLTKPTPASTEEAPKEETKTEKRPYKKRKRVDANGQPLPPGEDDDSNSGSEEDKKTKKARTQREKSLSPVYPPKTSFTAEQLMRPQDPYATLLYKLLMDVYPEALPLKQIYRRMKSLWPYYIHGVGTEGWQSSVRHNLNQEADKLFSKGEKEGKGFAWRAIPGKEPGQQEKKKTAVQQQASKPKQSPPRQQLPTSAPATQNIQWHPSPAYPLAQGGPAPVTDAGWQAPQQQGAAMFRPGAPPVPQNAQTAPGQANRLQQGAYQASPTMSTPNSSSRQPGTPNVAGRGPPTNPPGESTTSSTHTYIPTMPCTIWGIEAIRRFEAQIYSDIKDDEVEKRQYWEHIFRSAKRKILYGFPGSIHPQGESDHENTVVLHMEHFTHKFANPNFEYTVWQKKEKERTGVLPPPVVHVKNTTEEGSSYVAGPSAFDMLLPKSEQQSDRTQNNTGTASA